MFRIAIDAGHGGNDSGASFRGLKEKDITLHIATQMCRGLFSIVDTLKEVHCLEQK
jgi:N-acetylmuramoyl-L-alanine amidase